jgi:hypothetical protein
LSLSVAVLVQIMPASDSQMVLPPGQVAWHPPLMQASPFGQIVPHAPQLPGLVLVSTQVEPHNVWPEAQFVVHTLLTHAVPAAQTCPQLPQLLLSEVVLEQVFVSVVTGVVSGPVLVSWAVAVSRPLSASGLPPLVAELPPQPNKARVSVRTASQPVQRDGIGTVDTQEEPRLSAAAAASSSREIKVLQRGRSSEQWRIPHGTRRTHPTFPFRRFATGSGWPPHLLLSPPAMHLSSLPSFLRVSTAMICLALPVVACSSSSPSNGGSGTVDSGTHTGDSGTTTDTGSTTTDSGNTGINDSGSGTTDTGSGSNDSSAPPEDSSAPPTDGSSSTGFPGTYTCMLQGMANISGIGQENLPFDGMMVVTQTGSAIVAVLTADGGTDCTVDFTATSSSVATVNANQMCVVTSMGIQATLTFTSPTGTATLSGSTVTANMPFNVSALSGAVTGTGTLTGPCTK